MSLSVKKDGGIHGRWYAVLCKTREQHLHRNTASKKLNSAVKYIMIFCIIVHPPEIFQRRARREIFVSVVREGMEGCASLRSSKGWQSWYKYLLPFISKNSYSDGDYSREEYCAEAAQRLILRSSGTLAGRVTLVHFDISIKASSI